MGLIRVTVKADVNDGDYIYKILDIDEKDLSEKPLVNDYLDDLKLRASQLVWEKKSKELKTLEDKLKSLRSEDARVEDELLTILSVLGD